MESQHDFPSEFDVTPSGLEVASDFRKDARIKFGRRACAHWPASLRAEATPSVRFRLGVAKAVSLHGAGSTYGM